ncbi:MAG: hypothetical protein KY468_08050 [Armatimonadetes bacterium]|nr:hypothetical protein [Armatimonadota bacterium]
MIRAKITALGESVALLLPDDVLKSTGFQIGDEIDITVSDGAVILRPVHEERREKLEAVIDDVLARRRDAYQRLA